MTEPEVFEYVLDPSELTAEQVLAATREIWVEMKTPGSQANAVLQEQLNLQPSDLPARVDEVFSIKASDAGFDAATITLLVVAIGGAVGAKLPVIVGDLWKYVILPQLRHRWGDKALADKPRKKPPAGDRG